MRDVLKSHIPIDLLVSNSDFNRSDTISQRWRGSYLLLSKKADVEAVVKKINNLLSEINININEKYRHEYQEFYLRPLKDLYLSGTATKVLYGKQGNGKLLWSFMAIAIFVLLLAIINYINLTTARSILRSKEVILKKVMGSGKGLLRFQFIAESILISFISFLLALTAIQLLIPEFNQLAMVQIRISEYNTPIYWILLIAAILLTGIISGFYPAIMLTSFRSVSNVQGQSMSGSRGVLFRRLLLTTQFSISIILIIGILTNLRQLQFARNANPGFDKDQVLLIETPGQFKEIFRERLRQQPGIVKVASHGNESLGEQYEARLEIDGLLKYFRYKGIDPDYLDVMGIDLIEGRNFSWDRKSDGYFSDDGTLRDNFPIIVNETAAREYWTESPVGKTSYNHIVDARKAEIIGVIKDVHYRSMHHKVEPIYYAWSGRSWSRMNVKISPSNIPETINIIEKEWKKVYGADPFVYSFLDEEVERQYTSDERTAKIIGYFTVLAIAIACMGLFALSSFMAVRRTKEIGIRKTLGASSMSIFVMLSREYIKWILLSIIIASPIAWFAMSKWLQTFAYRIELGPGVFILAATLALVIGLITVGWQALKSANSNPVEALRYE
jgi:putative ABC transport system permease protein